MNFWDQNHPLAADNTRLYDELVPSSGNCPTLQGEMMRAAGKIGYDWYNNGWGCNNWSGAVVFLVKHADEISQKRTEVEKAEFHKALSVAHDYSHGERCNISDERADVVVTAITTYIVQGVLDNPTPIANTRDMYDYSEKAAHDYNDDDDYDGY